MIEIFSWVRFHFCAGEVKNFIPAFLTIKIILRYFLMIIDVFRSNLWGRRNFSL